MSPPEPSVPAPDGGGRAVRVRGRPELLALRVNRLRISEESLRARLTARGFGLERIPGLPAFLRVSEEPYPISQTLEHWLGLFYLQQAASGAAALALGPCPGERILDLCAAPGGKATHLAERMEGGGLVVAGDSSPGRVRALVGNLYRLGHTNVLSVQADGRTLPEGAGFDRVLADVPCSGEGNPRRRRGSFSRGGTSEGFRGHITGVQRALLERAVELTRPGGTILYATCTSAVEENEAVVARALRRLPVSIEAIDVELDHEEGVTRAGGRQLPEEMRRAWRIGPELLGSGNLFMARLRREESGDPPALPRDPDHSGFTPVPPSFDSAAASVDAVEGALPPALEALEHEMGVPKPALAAARWMIRGDSVWLHSVPEWPVDAWRREQERGGRATWQILALGVRAFQLESSGRLRPTNDLLRVLDGKLRGRVIDVGPEEASRLVEDDLDSGGTSDGYVALRLEGHVIGRAFARGGRVRSEVPRPEAKMLARALAASR